MNLPRTVNHQEKLSLPLHSAGRTITQVSINSSTCCGTQIGRFGRIGPFAFDATIVDYPMNAQRFELGTYTIR